MLRTFAISRRFICLMLMALTFFSLASAQDASNTAKRGRKYKAPPPTARFEVTVLRATNGKPVENASVIFHPLENGRDNGNMELKTNDEGKAVIDLLELGTSVRLQIIAPGFQTYGEDYKVDKDNVAVEVKLKRPAGQYSIYKKSEGKATPDDKSTSKPDDAPKDGGQAAPPAGPPKDYSKAPDSSPK